MARNAVLITISQGTEVTIVTSTFLFDISLVLRRVSMLSMGTSPITLCYDVERLETKTQVGLGPGESIEYTKHRVSLEGHLWPGCYPVSNTWYPYSYGQTKQKRGLNNVGQVNPEDCYLSKKYSGLQGGDIQVVKPYKCGWRGPAGRLKNVWNGHPAGPCPERGDASGRMGCNDNI